MIMNIKQLLTTKSKEEAAFIMFSNDLKLSCIFCKNFCGDNFNNWKCNNKEQSEKCWNEWDSFLEYKLTDKDKNDR